VRCLLFVCGLRLHTGWVRGSLVVYIGLSCLWGVFIYGFFFGVGGFAGVDQCAWLGVVGGG